VFDTAKEPPKTGTHYITGLVIAQDIPGARVRVQLKDLDGCPSYWLAVGQKNTQNNKDFYMPDEGEQVAVLFDFEYEDGVVMCSVYSTVDTPPSGMTGDKRHTTFKDGATLEYDRSLHLLNHLGQDGAIIEYNAAAHALTMALPSGATMTISAEAVELAFDASGNIKVRTPSADIDFVTSLFATSLNQIISIFNAHVHSGVTTGSGDTAVPTTTIP